MIDLAHGLLTSRFPALGILVTRGVLPLTSFLDAGVLLERLLMARDRLDLSPQDPIETVVDAVHFDVLDPREAESEALADVQRSLTAKEAEVETYRNSKRDFGVSPRVAASGRRRLGLAGRRHALPAAAMP